MELLSPNKLKLVCPVKWHEGIPENGISLGVADVDFKGPDGIVQYIQEMINEDYSFYQDQSGLEVATDSIIHFLEDRRITAAKENIQLIPGTMLGIYAAMKFASRREGKVVCLGPIYEPIHKHAADTGNTIDWVKIENNGLIIDELTEMIDSKTKLIAICNPTNPIGHVFTDYELIAIRDLSEEYNIPCFSDELYEPLIFKGNHTPLASIEGMEDRTISLYGFSKAYGLAGYRSGFMHIGTNITEEVKGIVKSQLVSPSPIASIVCKFALDDNRSLQWVKEFKLLMKKNTRKAAKLFTKKGYDCNTPDACFFIFPDIKTDDERFAETLLSNQGVQVIPGNNFGPSGSNHIRINCGTSEKRLMEGINRILDELSYMEK